MNRFNSRRKSVFAEAYNPEEDDEEDNKKVCVGFFISFFISVRNLLVMTAL